MNPAFWLAVEAAVAAGRLRALGPVFARFIDSLGPSPAPLVLATLLLSELEGRGHSCLELEALASDPAGLLGWETDEWQQLVTPLGALPRSLKAWSEQIASAATVWRPGDIDYGEPLVLDGVRLYLRRYWRDENLVAASVRARTGTASSIDVDRVRSWLDRLFATDRRSHTGPDWQRLACAIALRGRLSVITGGPGTGKTYTVARLLALLFAQSEDPMRLRVALAAPTGKAAARLKQSIDKALLELAPRVADALDLNTLVARMGAARTLHSLLGSRPDTRAFVHHAGNPLDVDVLIVDEASMVHLEMMAALLSALAPNASVIFLGDKDQLASVEAGAVLGDLCHSAEAGGYTDATANYAEAASGEVIPPEYRSVQGALAQHTVMLRQSRRFSGPIGELALAVNGGEAEQACEILHAGHEQLAWTAQAQPAQVLPLAVAGYAPYLELVAQGPGPHHEDWVRRILGAFEGFRILCALRDGEWGVSGLNTAIEQRLEQLGLIRKRAEWYAGRPVMVTRNDYGSGVFNGDIGIVLPDPARADAMRVYFMEGDAVRSVLATRLAQCETAFAMTVHKSQGSEFAHTALVLPRERAPMITRELIYTGITRARERFTLVSGAPEVLQDGIERRTQRASGLRARLA